MKKIFFLLITVVLISCGSTESDDDELRLIGAVTFQMKRTAVDGTVLGQYFQVDHTSGIKVELIAGAEVVAIGHTMESDSVDCFFVFDDVETGVEYRVKASLGDELFKISDAFTISVDDIDEISAGDFKATFGMVPNWFVDGDYYLGLMEGFNKQLRFDFFQDNDKVSVLPRPPTPYPASRPLSRLCPP